jgi:hypothetical protein
VGGRSQQRAMRYRSPSPPSLPRAVPAVSEEPAPQLAKAVPQARLKAVELARSLVGKSRVQLGSRLYDADCTGLVYAIFDAVGLSIGSEGEAGDNGVTAIFRYADRHGRIFEGGRPLPGDLVFFRETYDVNKDGRTNDGLTHVGLVEEVGTDGTVSVIHRVARGVVRYRMNLEHRALKKDPATGKPINDVLRAPGTERREVLTGQLFRAYGTVLPVEPRLSSASP